MSELPELEIVQIYAVHRTDGKLLSKQHAKEIIRRSDCHDDLMAVCEDTISLLAETAEMNICPFPFSAVGLNKRAKAALTKAREK